MRQTVILIAAMATAMVPAFAGENAEGRHSPGDIQVHGHWVMDVKNPDGTLAAHKEFENSLTTGMNQGNNFLATLLAGSTVPGPWAMSVLINGTLLYNIVQTSAICFSNPEGCATGMTVTVSNQQIIFQGTTTPMLAPGPVSYVATSLATCAATTNPPACLTASEAQWTAYDVTYATPAGITVLAGQVVAVTVTISFS